MPVGSSQVVRMWHPRSQSALHLLDILRTASCCMDCHNPHRIVEVLLWISLYNEAHNYTAVPYRHAVPSVGLEKGIWNLSSNLQEIRTTPTASEARFLPHEVPL